MLGWSWAALLAANLALLLPAASPLRVAGAFLLIGLLPGLSWTHRLLAPTSPLLRWTVAAALSYTLTSLVTLLLHYLPGPIQTWQLLIGLNALAICPLLLGKKFPRPALPAFRLDLRAISSANLPLLLILLLALLLRTLNLHYSEFQGDEALAMIAAAEALEGHADALFLRAKGPAEVLLPLALWRLTGVINEPLARLPFTVAALLAVVTVYLIGARMGGRRAGWLAAGFFAFNGFMVAFGRIVQYQALVVWLSAMAFLLAEEWYATRQPRLALLSGLCLGTGLLAHYDAILVMPAISWLFIASLIPRPVGRSNDAAALHPSHPPPMIGPESSEQARDRLAAWMRAALYLIAAFLLTTLPFYWPYALDPQANRTGAYVGERIGQELRNNLPDFFHFNTFYSSAYYTVLTGLLVLGWLSWTLQQARWSRGWAPALAVVSILAVIFHPTLLAGATFDLTGLPFALTFLAAFLALAGSHRPAERATYGQALLAWLAIPFLGYNFVVALGLTHIYTTVPAWSLLAALSWSHFFDNSLLRRFSHFLLAGLAVLSTLFLWNAFIRHDIEYWQDYPAGNLPLYWNPYQELPAAGFFGFAHRAGWKAVGQKIATGELSGDYGSNEEPDITTWYTRGAPRACDPHPEFYFLAADLIDPLETPAEIIASDYEQIGQVTLPNQKQLPIMQRMPSTMRIGSLDDLTLARDFDRTAVPAAFARSARGSIPVEANFSHLVRLIGYDLDLRRAHPGGRVPVTLYWQALAPLPASYQVFTHLEGSAGLVAQADGVPVCWTYPTDRWRPGQIIADQHAILIPPDAPPGDYPLQVGLYLADTFKRLDVLDAAGQPAGTSVTLTVVKVGSRK